MKMPHPKVFLLILAASIGLNLLVCPALWTQQSEQSPEPQTETVETQEVIEPGPKDIKEAVGIYAFLGWIWLSIFVLIYILRQKIKEVDRIYRLKYFSSRKN
ncbi:MAG: hypothetical protein PVH84_09420 [Candidatus Aminicenantes bacterium]